MSYDRQVNWDYKFDPPATYDYEDPRNHEQHVEQWDFVQGCCEDQRCPKCQGKCILENGDECMNCNVTGRMK